MSTRLIFGFISLRVSKNLIFHIAIFQIFMLSRGQTLTDVFYGISISALVGTFSEAPTGVLADRYGRRLAIIIGQLLILVSYILLFYSSATSLFWLSLSITAIGNAFISGTDSALLYDSIDEHKMPSAYTKWEGWGYASSLIAYGASASIGSLTADKYGLEVPILLSVVGASFGLIAVMYLPSKRNSPRNSTKTIHGTNTILMTLVQIFRNPRLRISSLYYVIIGSVVGFGTSLFQPLFTNVGLPIALLGPLVGFLIVVDVFGVHASNARNTIIFSDVRVSRISKMFMFVFGLCILSSSFVQNDSIAIVILIIGYSFHALGDGFHYAPVMNWVNSNYHEGDRATLLSTLSMVYGILVSATTAAAGLMISEYGASATGVMIVAFIVFLQILDPHIV